MVTQSKAAAQAPAEVVAGCFCCGKPGNFSHRVSFLAGAPAICQDCSRQIDSESRRRYRKREFDGPDLTAAYCKRVAKLPADKRPYRVLELVRVLKGGTVVVEVAAAEPAAAPVAPVVDPAPVAPVAAFAAAAAPAAAPVVDPAPAVSLDPEIPDCESWEQFRELLAAI